MKEIIDYIQKQLILSAELNKILKQYNTLEDNSKNVIYNNSKIKELGEVNNENVSLLEDRISAMQKKVSSLLKSEDAKKDRNFYNYLINLNTEISKINFRLNQLNISLDNATKMHNHKMAHNKGNNAEIPYLPNEEGRATIKKNPSKFEFKIGANALNIIGAILILIAFITFGRYFYINYINDVLKGISLFVISTAILISGEVIIKNKLPKFSNGISALGVGSLFSSILINYLVLNTINSYITILLTVIVTTISIYISKTNNSNTIRIISSLGSYCCLISMEYLYGFKSYITIAVLIIINIASVLQPIKKKEFSIYSSIINTFFCAIIVGMNFLEPFALVIYSIYIFAINNYLYFKYKDGNKDTYILCHFITSVIMILQTISTDFIIPLSLCYIAISILFYVLSKDTLIKNIFYIQGSITILLLITSYYSTLLYFYPIILILLSATTTYLIYKEHNNFLNVINIAFILIAMIHYLLLSNFLASILYLSYFTLLIWLFSDKYKDNVLLICFKYFYQFAIIYLIVMKDHLTISTNIKISTIINILFILVYTNINKLKHTEIETCNFVLGIISLTFINLFFKANIPDFLVTFLISIALVLIITNKRYNNIEFFYDKRHIIYSLFITYGIIILFSISNLHGSLSNVFLSIVLMVIAFANVWIGFVIRVLDLRRYGLILSLLICLKVILIDFYMLNFVMKTLLFLVVGIIALSISYIYSKLEKKLEKE